jgi:hypothetical protein
VYPSKQADWRFQITTPNAAARLANESYVESLARIVYYWGYASLWYVYIPINTKNGPVLLDIPPAVGAGLCGNLNDAWQIPEADVGPTGEDGGKGGKHVMLPPGYEQAVPPGHFAVRFRTYNGYSFLRAIPETTLPEHRAPGEGP